MMKRPLILIAALTGTLALAGCSDDAPAQGSAQAEPSAGTEQTAEAGQTTRTLEGILEFDAAGQALPEDAEVIVSLQDVALADAPATIIAETTIALDGSEPTDFRLDYPADAVSLGHAHALHATIRGAEDALLWTTTQRHAVEVGPDAEQGPITLVLEPVTGTPLADAGAPSGEQESLQEAQENLLKGGAASDSAGDEAGSVEAVSEQAADMQEPSEPVDDDTEAADESR